MNQRSFVIAVILLAVIVAGGGYLLVRNNIGKPGLTPPPAATPPPTATPPPAGGVLQPSPPPGSPPPAASQATLHTISMVSNAFSPDTIRIRVGDTVVFKNSDVKTYWPASAVHPTHQVCPGFDALGMVRPGETYSHIFTVAKECPFHDHLNPGVKGKIIVTP